MHIMGLHVLDAAVILACIIAIAWVVWYASQGVKKETDFFAGGRTMGGWLQFFLNFAQMTDSSGAPTVATEVYREGAGGMWPAYQPLFNTPFYWFSSIWYRRTRLITNSDLMLERFNSRGLAMGLIWWYVMLAPINGGLGNIVSYKVAAAMFVKPESAWTDAERANVNDYRKYQSLSADFAAGKLSPAELAIYQQLDARQKRGELSSYISYIRPVPFYIFYTTAVILYIVFGGLKAAAYANLVQGILIIVLSFVLIPIGLYKIGGLHALHQAAPAHFFNLFGAEAVSDYTWFSILAFLFMGLVCLGDPIVNPSGRDERAMRVGTIGAAFCKRLVMIGWMFCGLIAVALFPHNGIADPDNTWGLLSLKLLAPGILGLMIAGILLGHMPGMAWSAIQFSAMFTRNLYEPMFPNKSSAHYRLVAQASIVGVLAASVIVSMFFSSIIGLFTAMVAMRTMLSAIGLLMLFWRRITPLAAGTGWIAWVVLIVVIPWLLPVTSLARLPALTLQTEAKSVSVSGMAGPADVAAGKAKELGDFISKAQALPPKAIFFENVVPVNPKDPASPLIGIGRFHAENFVMYWLGVPLRKFSSAGLLAARWTFDATAPFVILFALSLIPRRLNSAAAGPVRSPSPEEHARVVMQGNISFLVQNDETAEEEKIRLDRFYGKLRTPIAPTPEEDEQELVKTFANPERFENRRLFPGTTWEFNRWYMSDVKGFLACWAGVLAVLALLEFVLRVGG